MCPGLSADLQLMDDSRKTAITNKELARLNINVACLQETRLADSGSLRKETTPPSSGKACPRMSRGRFCHQELTDCHHRNPLQRVIKNSCPSHENVGGLCEHHIRLRPDSDLHPRSQGSILRVSAGNTIQNPKFRGHIFARRFQHSRWDQLASMAYLPWPLRRQHDE